MVTFEGRKGFLTVKRHNVATAGVLAMFYVLTLVVVIRYCLDNSLSCTFYVSSMCVLYFAIKKGFFKRKKNCLFN